MKFASNLVALIFALSVTARPVKRGVDPNLVPQFGVSPGVNPTGTGDCDGINGVKIPCSCPPDRNSFIQSLNANVAANHAVNNPSIGVSFPTDNSQASQLARIQAALVTLQNLRGPGVGCPAASTTFVAQQKAIQAGTAPPPAAPAAAPPPPPAPAAPAGVDPNLVPQFGVNPGVNPTGTGDCDGINGVKIPCSCPPDRNSFIQSLSANVAANHAVNNPSVPVSFPTDNSKNSQLARIEAAIITLQNLHGPGVGCPAAATTFLAQQKAIQDGTAPPPAAAPAAAPPPPPAPAAPAGVDPALVPQFGVSPGVNPTGTGDCDGINGIKIPCSCPPDRNSFIQSLSANAIAGHATNNPSVSVSFPTGNSKDDQKARIEAAIITLQNLHGPGVGCPAASTTFVAQQQALN